MKSQEKNEVTNNKVKISDKAKKIWMAIKRKLEEKIKLTTRQNYGNASPGEM